MARVEIAEVKKTSKWSSYRERNRALRGKGGDLGKAGAKGEKRLMKEQHDARET